jgi:predicted nucleotide-binding protein (sugar kinase/HSP70/actin superfamily)
MIIGLPRALFYFKRPYFWENFFENLGFKILISPQTNKEIVERGTKISDPETCFSQKVFFGHLLWLDEKCDLIFVPRLKTNFEKLEYCPKFFALPDLAKIFLKTKILTENFDERKEKFEKSLENLGEKLNKNKKEIERAFKFALLKEKNLKERQKKDFFEKIKSNFKKIVLISHPYNLYDSYINLDIKKKLEKLKVEPIFIDEVQSSKSKIQSLDFKFHWEFAKEIMEKVKEILKYKISGAIEISSFQCGCDAVLKEFVEKEFKKRKIPFLYLLIDEQTGEAGFQTRLEAFVDTINQ